MRAVVRYYVYVIELRPLRRTRPHAKPDVYVGSSALTPRARFAKHLTHDRSSRHVRHRGVRLRPDLYPASSFSSRRDAKAMEHRLAHELETRGHRVYGSCSPRVPECVM